MTVRSGKRVGQQLRDLLTAVRQAGREEGLEGPAAGDNAMNGAGVTVNGATANGTVSDGTVPGGTVPGARGLTGPGATDHAGPATAPASRIPPADTGTSGASVPRWLLTAGGWAWRLLFIGVAAYVIYRVAVRLAVVVVPCAGALLLTALLQPLTSRLKRAGMPTLAATWCTLFGAVIVLAGAITLVTMRVRAEYPALKSQVQHTTHQLQGWLAGAPLHLKTGSLQKTSNNVLSYLGQHKSLVAGTVLTGSEIVFEVLGGIVLMLFVTFFLLKDGDRIWAWFSRAFGASRDRADRGARAAWQAVVYYIRGTVVVAAIHAVVIGLTLTIMGVPLVAALAVLVFLAAFVPLVGILLAGAVVVLITLATKGWIAAVIVLAVFVAEDQLESHLLQPLVVGRFVRLHPLAIILALAVGGVVAGIPGAVVAVPIAAAVTRAVPELRRRTPVAVSGSAAASAPGPASGAGTASGTASVPGPVPASGPGRAPDPGTAAGEGGDDSDPAPGPR